MGKYLRHIIIAVLVSLYVFFRVPEFFYGSGHFAARALTYSFFHASWLHLAVNCIAVWNIFAPSRKRFKPLQFVTVCLIAVLVYPLALRPVLGFSNILFAVLGLRAPALSSAWWKRREVIIFIAVNILTLFIPRISAVTHIAAFASGMLLAALRRSIQPYLDDVRRLVK